MGGKGRRGRNEREGEDGREEGWEGEMTSRRPSAVLCVCVCVCESVWLIVSLAVWLLVE